MDRTELRSAGLLALPRPCGDLPAPGPCTDFPGRGETPGEGRCGQTRRTAGARGPFKQQRGARPGEGRARGRISAARRPRSRIWSARRRRGRRGRRGGACLGLGRSSLPSAAARLRPHRQLLGRGRRGRHFRALTWDALACLRAPGRRDEGPAGAAEGRECRPTGKPGGRDWGCAGQASPRAPKRARLTGARPALPEPRRIPRPSRTLRCGVVGRVIHRQAAISWDAPGPPPPAHTPCWTASDRSWDPRGCLGPAGLSVRAGVTRHLPAAARRSAQDRPSSLLRVPSRGHRAWVPLPRGAARSSWVTGAVSWSHARIGPASRPPAVSSYYFSPHPWDSCAQGDGSECRLPAALLQKL